MGGSRLSQRKSIVRASLKRDIVPVLHGHDPPREGHMTRRIRRREFIVTLGGVAAAWPFAARSQQPDRMRRIGVLMATAADEPESQARLAAFLQGLQQLGWTDGRNLRIEYRWSAGGAARL